MMIDIAKWIVIAFGLFLIGAALMMLFAPKKVRHIISKAGSTNLINYSEITIRMIPAVALILSADFSKYPELFKVLGWFMLVTSLILFFVPRQIHHSYSVRCADIIKPLYFQFISPFSFLFGTILIYSLI